MSLTDREEEIIRLIAVKGLTMRRAAQTMGISEVTAQLHVKHLRAKLGARTSVHAAYLWLLSKANEEVTS